MTTCGEYVNIRDMARKLTKKEKGFVKDYVKTGNATEAALKNYEIKAIDKENVAGAIGSENLTKPKIIQAIAERLPDDLLSERHLELLNKREVATAFDHESGERIKVVVDQPDTQAVSKALDMAYKIKGTYAPEKSVSMNVNINPQDPKALALAEEYEKKLKENL